MPTDDPLPVEVLRAVVTRVRAVGGRVAVHTQNRAGGAAAVAGTDSRPYGRIADEVRAMVAAGVPRTTLGPPHRGRPVRISASPA